VDLTPKLSLFLTVNLTCAQIHLNFQRKSVVGLSFDFLALNWLGFICYSIFNVAMLVSPTVRAAYRQQMGSSPGVRLNDAIFAVHAALMTSAQCSRLTPLPACCVPVQLCLSCGI